MPVRTRGRRLPLPAAVLLVVASAAPAAAQTTYTWNPTSSNTNWLDPGNWTGGPAGTFPGLTGAGLPNQGAATDVARINQFTQGFSNGLGIDFGAAGGMLTVGAAWWNIPGAGSGLAIGNTSTTTLGTLRLNGATVAGVANVLAANTDPQTDGGWFTLANNPGNSGLDAGSAGMVVQLGISNGTFLVSGGSILVRTSIAEAAPGSGFSVRGGFELILLQPNAFTGPVRVTGSSLVISRDDRLGPAPGVATPNRIVLEPDPTFGFPGELNTDAASFTISPNRGIAVGPASGTGDGTINVPDPDLFGYTATVTYNGVITDNGSGTGRLVLTGGGTLVLGGSGTFTGGTLNSAGVLLLTNVNALGTTGTVTLAPQRSSINLGTPLPGHLLVQAAGTFSRPIVVDYTGATNHPVTIGTPDFPTSGPNETLFSGAISLNGRPVTIQGGNDYRTRFTGPITGTGSVTVTGTAADRVVVFDGGTGNDFTYSGGTTVASGTLLAVGQSPTTSATGTGPVAVTGGTLGGNGRVAGAVTVGSAGRITAGTSLATRILNLGSTLQIDGGKYRVTLFGSGNDEASRLAVVGAATLTNSPSLELDLNGQTVQSLRAGGPRTYLILNAAWVTPNGFAAPNFTSLGFDASEWSLSYPNGNMVVLSFTPVPEPAAVLVLAALAGACGLVRRGIRVGSVDARGRETRHLDDSVCLPLCVPPTP